MIHSSLKRMLLILGIACPLMLRGSSGLPSAPIASAHPLSANAAQQLPGLPSTRASSRGMASAVPIAPPVHSGSLTASDIERLSQNANQRVMVLFRDQHTNLLGIGANAAMRSAALASDQSAVLSQLAQVGAPDVHAYHLINAVSATVSQAEEAQLATLPQVLSVLPDATIQGPSPSTPAAPVAASAPSSATCSSSKAEFDPEALQLTHTAFSDPTVPQAQQLATGKGVTVAFIADGLDPNNPDFIRPDGSHVFVDYKDFSGEGPNAPSDSREAFGDASSIAAQGRQTYNINTFVNTAHQTPGGCIPIKIVGVAPGASLMGLKVFGQNNIAYNSAFVQAIEYAMDLGANVINESFGGNPFPDNANDPVSLADDAAVATGVTVVVSTGDAGTAHTIQSPSSDPNVIAAGATTQFLVYAQTVDGGIQLGSGGYVDNNISSFSSAGPAQSGKQTVDVVAPSDLGWALCSPNVAVYLGCTDYNGNPSPIQVFGGTSESSPLTAGEAALVIEAYRRAHGGTSPSPALVKTIITSTADDLGAPGYEQGAGLINSLRAVQAALSYKAPSSAQGSNVLVSPSTLSAEGYPGDGRTFSVQATNAGAGAETVKPIVRQFNAPFARASYVLTLDPTSPITFTDAVGVQRVYATQTFTVPGSAQRLDASIAWNTSTQPGSSPVRLSLFDPQGRFVAFSIPQDPGFPFPNSNFGHVDVNAPTPGTWKAVVWTHAGSTGYAGPVHLSVTSSTYSAVGTVSPPSLLLQPGQSGTFNVTVQLPSQPGDASEDVVVSATDAHTNTTQTAIPITLRTLVPLTSSGGSFSGTLTGGNGRFGSPGETLTYAFDVPGGMQDIELGVSIPDNSYNLEGVLVTPDGRPIDVQSTVTALDGLGLPLTFTSTMQFFYRSPPSGRWRFILLINDTISGNTTSLPFQATIAFNGVRVSASGVPNDLGMQVASGKPTIAHITVTNTGNTAKDFFLDPRLAQSGLVSLGGFDYTLPVTIGEVLPAFYVPPETTSLTVATESMTPTVPVNMDIFNENGAPPFGATGSPDIEATSLPDPFTGNYAAVASSNAPEVVPGAWGIGPTEVGPYPAAGATPSSGTSAALVTTQLFDPSANPTTGDAHAILTGQASGPYEPLSLPPGASGTIDVTFTPSASPGTVVSGVLYVDAFNQNSATIGLTTVSGDELAAIPYSYTVGAH